MEKIRRKEISNKRENILVMSLLETHTLISMYTHIRANGILSALVFPFTPDLLTITFKQVL